MIKFLRNAFIFLFLCAVICLLVLSRANGESDAYYERLTTPAQTSLIIGTSRSAQGILPSILNSELGRSDIYNFSFTISHSPYGPVYLDRIDQKLLKNSKNGIFILSVDRFYLGKQAHTGYVR
jgi:zona occludens toxin (predicted ATPase)